MWCSTFHGFYFAINVAFLQIDLQMKHHLLRLSLRIKDNKLLLQFSGSDVSDEANLESAYIDASRLWGVGIFVEFLFVLMFGREVLRIHFHFEQSGANCQLYFFPEVLPWIYSAVHQQKKVVK